jgi:molecular chaperone DnaJ
MKDYYKILEVEEKASQQDIKKSYRTLSKKYHPDVNPEGADKFKDIAEAYDTIGNPDKRAQYDQTKNNPFAGGMGGMGGSSFEEMFNQMFNRGGGAQRTRRKSVPDKIVKVQITPIESYQGIEKKIQYLKDTQCGTCSGTGGQQQTCTGCNGAGFQIKTFGTGFMVQQIRQACESCGGRGYTLIHKCHTCNGNGTKNEMGSVNFKLPKGVDSGQYLKLENFGDFRHGEIGDLVIQIELIEKDGFEKMNNDLIYNLFLDLNEVNADRLRVPHPDGELMLSQPKIFDTSKPLRLKGKGYNGGDMYVKLNVRFERP